MRLQLAETSDSKGLGRGRFQDEKQLLFSLLDPAFPHLPTSPPVVLRPIVKSRHFRFLILGEQVEEEETTAAAATTRIRMDKVLEYKENISKRLERYDKIVDLEKQTGIDKFYIFVAGAVLTGILLFVIGGAELVVSLVGFIYPAYQSFKAISTPNTDDDTQWLTYWVVYSFFNMTESITDLLLSWIPFYFFIKVAFLVWCYHPSTSGSNVIYFNLVKPYLAPHVSSIDAAVKSATDAAKAVTSKAE